MGVRSFIKLAYGRPTLPASLMVSFLALAVSAFVTATSCGAKLFTTYNKSNLALFITGITAMLNLAFDLPSAKQLIT